jgi:transcriptional regulator with XRE-family HTH domain
MAMILEQISSEVLRRRLAMGLTQAELAARAGLSRATVNAIENDTVPDIGARKLAGLLEVLGAQLDVSAIPAKRGPDFLKIAATSASVSFRETLTASELRKILLTGRVPRRFRPHVRALLNEAPEAVWRGLTGQIRSLTTHDRLTANMRGLARRLGGARDIEAWLDAG